MKRQISCLVFLSVFVFLSGCWDRREINELAIVKAIGIDKIDENYEVTLQIINPGVVSGNQSNYDSPVSTFSEVGTTVLEAIRHLTVDIPRRPYFAHLRMIIISEEVARDGISPFLDFLLRDHEQRPDVYLVVSKEKRARDALEVLTSLEVVPANNIFFSLETSAEVLGETIPVNLTDAISKLVTDGEELVLSGIIVEGPVEEGNRVESMQQSAKTTRVELTGLGIFHHDRLVGWLKGEESEVYNFIMNNIDNAVISVPCGEKYYAVEASRSHSKVKGTFKNGKPKINIYVNIVGHVDEVECPIDITDVAAFTQLGEKASDHLQKQIEMLIKKVQREYKTDIFSFGRAFHRADPKKWNELKENWEAVFSQLEVEVNVNIELRHKGMMRKSVNKEVNAL